MNVALSVFSSINLMLIVVFAAAAGFVGHQKKIPQIMAFYSVFLAVLFLIYFISILFVGIAAISAKKYSTLCLLIFIFIPFIIGKYVSYEKLRIFSNIQLFVLFLSLFLALFFINL